MTKSFTRAKDYCLSTTIDINFIRCPILDFFIFFIIIENSQSFEPATNQLF